MPSSSPLFSLELGDQPGISKFSLVWFFILILRFKADDIRNKDLRGAVNKYLNVGDWVLDQSIALMSNSAYFEKKR